jgi:hypothetical protein
MSNPLFAHTMRVLDAIFPEPAKSAAKLDYSAVKTSTLRKLEAEALASLQAAKGPQIDGAEDIYSEIAAELEHRLTRVTVGGRELQITITWMSQQCCAWRADGEQPNRIGMGADAWEARDELESLLEDFGVE